MIRLMSFYYRGGGEAAAQGLFLALGPESAFMLACESAKERNAAVSLLRYFARSKGFQVFGPDDIFSATATDQSITDQTPATRSWR
jgi:hypothetical protein